MKRFLAGFVVALALVPLALSSPAQAHDESNWYPRKWSLSESGNQIKWGLMADWFTASSSYEARAQDAAERWTSLGGNRNLNQRNDWGTNWNAALCSPNFEQNGLRSDTMPDHPAWLAGTYACPDTHGHLYSANMKVDPGRAWYTGTGSPGSSQYDFTTVMLHEFGHLLGFAPHWDQNGAVSICGYNNPPYHLMCSEIHNGDVGGILTHDQHTFNNAY